MNKIVIAIVVLVLIGLGIFALAYKQIKDTPYPPNSPSENATTESNATVTEVPTATTPSTPASVAPKLTLEEVAKHNSKASCYSIINGSVHDLTSWISKHPGGEKGILSICGKDGTSAFMSKHGGGQKQIDLLATFKIGPLVQ